MPVVICISVFQLAEASGNILGFNVYMEKYAFMVSPMQHKNYNFIHIYIFIGPTSFSCNTGIANICNTGITFAVAFQQFPILIGCDAFLFH